MTRVYTLLIMLILVLISGCSPQDVQADNITFEGTIEEVSDTGWLVTTSDAVGFDKAWVSFSDDVAIAFNPLTGQRVQITIKPEIRESYPVQVSAVSVSLVASKDDDISTAFNLKITAEEAKDLMATEKDFVLVDVRTQEEYNQGYIEGAKLLPVDKLETLAPVELPDLDQVIFLYCRSGNRSGAAARILETLGYTKIYDFGGIINWPYDIVKP